MIDINKPLTEEEKAQMDQNLIDQAAGLTGVKNPVLAPEMTLPELQDRVNDPLFVAPDLLGKLEFNDVATGSPEFQNPDKTIGTAPVVSKNNQTSDNKDNKSNPNGNNPSSQEKSAKEALLQEYLNLTKKQETELDNARQSDRNLALIGALGDSLGTYLNAKGQMNVKAPGVKVEQGVGAANIAKQFQNADQISSDLKGRREALLAQYRQMAIDENARLNRDLQRDKINSYERRADEGRGMAQKNYELRLREADLNRVKGIQEGFNKDKLVQKAEERINSARSLKELVNLDNPISQEAAKTFAARASGEVGALSNQDREAFGGSKAIMDRVTQSLNQAATGKLSEENKKFMSGLAEAFERAGNRDLNDRLKTFSQQATKRTNFTESEAAEIIRPGSSLQESTMKQEDKVEVIGPDGKQYRLPKRQLDSAIKQGYKLK